MKSNLKKDSISLTAKQRTALIAADEARKKSDIMYGILSRSAEKARNKGNEIDPAKIYATGKTGMMSPTTPKEIEEFHNAYDEYWRIYPPKEN
jgi:hypothetical protein